MYNDDNIKKMVEDAIKNMDPNGEFFKNVVSQITEQVKKEQEKISEPKISHKLKEKADTYLTNNKSLDDYISNRDKFMGVFDKIAKDKIKEDVNQLDKKLEQVKESLDDLEKNNSSNNISYTSYTSGWKQTTNKNGNPVGYLYFNFNSNSDHPDTYKQILDYYSILSLHSDEWDNWNHFGKDIEVDNLYLSILVDDYVYQFEENEREIIDSGDDNVTSFIYTKLDDKLKMFSIYILNYSGVTNKIYDYIRLIITPPTEVTEIDYENYYRNLKKYFGDVSKIDCLLEDYNYTYIDRFKINHHLPDHSWDKALDYLQDDILKQIKDKIDSEPNKVEIKKEDTPDKTNSILDKLGIPHDEKGNVEIPITNIFTKSRFPSVMNQTSNFLKSWFDFDEETDIGDTEAKNKSSNEYTINTGNKYYDDFLSKAINDGYIEVEFLSPESVHLNINGTYVFMNNPYGKF